jgi:hypothetical protein
VVVVFWVAVAEGGGVNGAGDELELPPPPPQAVKSESDTAATADSARILDNGDFFFICPTS